VSDDDRIEYLAGEPVGALDPAERADLDQLRALLSDPSVWAQPSPRLADSVAAAVADAAASATPDGHVPARVTRHRRIRRPRAAAALAGLAAAAAIAVGLAFGRSGGSQPVQYQATLAGTALAPAATAQVTLVQTPSGWRITLQGRGLPRLDNGSYYEAWLKSPAGILVPVGTFNQPTSVTLWSGVPPTQYPAITITRQRAYGHPASSGQRVLAGVAHRAN
jgi:hypothetical protein